MMRRLLLALIGILATITSTMADKEPPYPSKVITVISPFAAGTSADVLARILSQKIGSIMGQPVVVENRPGALGEIGVRAVLKAPADGYTLCYCYDGQISILPAAHAVRGPSGPYDPQKDFIPIGSGGRLHFVMLVNNDFPGKTWQDVVAHVRANAGKMNVAFSNPTSALVAGIIKTVTKLPVEVVPYTGEPKAMTDLIAGHVQIMAATTTNALPQVAAGKVKLIGVIGPEPNPFFPGLKTLAEQGAPEFGDVPVAWGGFFAKSGTPPDRLAIFAKALNQALSDKETLNRLRDIGLTATITESSAFSDQIARETETYIQLLRKTGVKLIGD